MASLSEAGRRVFHIRRAREAEQVQREVRDLSIKVADPALPVSSLSGGNQQKVVIGKALMTAPKVLLMDEPSRGIDIGAKGDVFRIMRSLAAQGIGILFVTSDLDEVLALSDRIAVMSQGRLTALFDRAEATEAKIVAASSIGHGPAAAQRTRKSPHERRRGIVRRLLGPRLADALSDAAAHLHRAVRGAGLFRLRGAELPHRRQRRADVEACRASTPFSPSA